MKTTTAEQYRLEGGDTTLRTYSFEPGEIDRLREQAKIIRCYGCNIAISERRAEQHWTYMPFSDEPDITRYCRECIDMGRDTEEEEFYCDGCNRDIYNSNGHRVNYKFPSDDSSTQLCVRCWQAEMFEHGHTEDDLNSGKIAIDWFDHSELAQHGFEEQQTIYLGDRNYRMVLAEWRGIVREWMEQGFICLTDQGPTGIGNSGPDWITIWTKEQD